MTEHSRQATFSLEWDSKISYQFLYPAILAIFSGLWLTSCENKQPLQTISVSAPQSIQASLIWLTDELGFFKEQDIQLDLRAYPSGKRALFAMMEDKEELAATAVDLLFSDVVMPGGLNGYELAEQVSAKKPGIKVLLTSGYTEKAFARNGQARFNTNLLSKPYSQAQLIQQIRALLDEPAE